MTSLDNTSFKTWSALDEFAEAGKRIFDPVYLYIKDSNGAHLERLLQTFNQTSTEKCVLFVSLTILSIFIMIKAVTKLITRKPVDRNQLHTAYMEEMFFLAKTASVPGHIKLITNAVYTGQIDVNEHHAGLTLFLCTCLSGNSHLVHYLLMHGADIKKHSSQGDSPLYLATFALLSCRTDSFEVLQDLLDAGCDINQQNDGGFTCLHRAASKGDIQLVRWLVNRGAKTNLANHLKVYPIDSAINAGHIEVAELLQVPVDDSRTVWDVVEPYTPPRVQLGLQSPRRRHLVESSRPSSSHPLRALSAGKTTKKPMYTV